MTNVETEGTKLMVDNQKDIPSNGFTTKGATLIELVVILVWLGCIILGANLLCTQFGGGKGWLLGGFIGGVIGSLALLVLSGVRQFLFQGIPFFPRCCNECSPKSYRIQKDNAGLCLVCACGARYRKRGRRFIIVNADDTESPYLVWVPFRGWRRDEGAYVA